MNKDRLFNSLDGLYAYDTGCTDSGINDELLREKVKTYLDSLSEEEFRVIMSTYIFEYFVGEEAIKNGYGIEDVASFIRWLNDRMGISL